MGFLHPKYLRCRRGGQYLAERLHPAACIVARSCRAVPEFLKPPWQKQKLNFKAAHLIYWWPTIERHFSGCADGDCWEVPITIKDAQPGRFKSLKVPDEVIAKLSTRAS